MKVKTIERVFQEIYRLGYISRGMPIMSIRSLSDMMHLQTDQYKDLKLPFPPGMKDYRFKLVKVDLTNKICQGILSTKSDHSSCYELNFVYGMCVISRVPFASLDDNTKNWLNNLTT